MSGPCYEMQLFNEILHALSCRKIKSFYNKVSPSFKCEILNLDSVLHQKAESGRQGFQQ